jgi:U6 snRNA-associated Sm-like protein LSm4
MVELKNGVTFNGHLVECDNFMNVTLKEVYQTSAEGDKFFKMKEMFIKGNIVGALPCPHLRAAPELSLIPG